MSEVVKVLMEYGLIRDVAEKIDLEARRIHFKETKIEPFEKIGWFALNIKIRPGYCINLPQMTHDKLTLITHMHNIKTGMDVSGPYITMFCEHSNHKITDMYNHTLPIKRAMELEGKCNLCRLPLTVDNMKYNNWQAYEGRRGYHKACKNYISPCKR